MEAKSLTPPGAAPVTHLVAVTVGRNAVGVVDQLAHAATAGDCAVHQRRSGPAYVGVQHTPTAAAHAELRDGYEAHLRTEPDNPQLWTMLAHLYMVEHSLSFNLRPDPLERGNARHGVPSSSTRPINRAGKRWR